MDTLTTQLLLQLGYPDSETNSASKCMIDMKQLMIVVSNNLHGAVLRLHRSEHLYDVVV